ncbi:hypothetical protein FHR99_000086 [Litorivivens lipolytica]|uniref:DUF1289 domain-containing protein n=1 Tax=Litorivivens lipolytica TaxID=1524264 RepID=A0A7W4W1U1_9GAMM|nr:DUF1289 domain-containing protein [Litorivivens lipolytica]MBB3045850.1 hypothetical protein [Litorivivens lipolytica]
MTDNANLVKAMPVKSPCISVCSLDDDDLCVGCFRTLKEITDWSDYSEDKKRAVVIESRQRMKEHYNLA